MVSAQDDAKNWREKMKILKKISASTVVGNVKRLREIAENSEGVVAPIMRVIGVAIATKSGVSQYGEWVSLRGQFSATNLETGEEFRGSSLFVPDELTDMIAAQLSQGVKSVEFAVDIGVMVSDAVIGYEYVVEPLLEPSENDPINSLIARIESSEKKVKQIGNQKKTEKRPNRSETKKTETKSSRS